MNFLYLQAKIIMAVKNTTDEIIFISFFHVINLV